MNKWTKMDWKDAREASASYRDARMSEGKLFLRENPTEPYWFSSSGDCFVLALRTDDGELEVFDLKPLRSEYTYEGEEE